jgi:chromosome segregation ATPase
MSTQEFLLARVEAFQNKVIQLEEELKLEGQKRGSLEWHYEKKKKLELNEIKQEVEKFRNKLFYTERERDALILTMKKNKKRIEELEAEVKLENENKRSHVVGLQLQIDDLQEDNNKLVEVIKGLDPTNPILQHLTL